MRVIVETRKTTALLALLVMVLLVVAACSGTDELSGPDPVTMTLGSSEVSATAKSCLSFAEICDELGRAVYEACPLKIGADPTDIALCKFYAFNDAYKGYEKCFSARERQQLFDCAKMWTPPPDEDPTQDGSGTTKKLPENTAQGTNKLRPKV